MYLQYLSRSIILLYKHICSGHLPGREEKQARVNPRHIFIFLSIYQSIYLSVYLCIYSIYLNL